MYIVIIDYRNTCKMTCPMIVLVNIISRDPTMTKYVFWTVDWINIAPTIVGIELTDTVAPNCST